MEYRKGERVQHPAQPDWGLGEILEDSNAGSVRIFFVGAGEKTLKLSHVQPTKVAGEAASHALLDNLKTDASGHAVTYKSLPACMEWFQELRFPHEFMLTPASVRALPGAEFAGVATTGMFAP